MTTSPAPRFYALVPCAGLGLREGTVSPKKYAPLAGGTVVGHTLRALAEVRRLANVLVVLGPQDDAFETQVHGFAGWIARVGGASRAETVANGLHELAHRGVRPDDWVLVHDAARCLRQPRWADALIDACAADYVGGLLALPVADTLKHEHDGRVSVTIDRAHKWQAQTPQMFRLGLLQAALKVSSPSVTDEAGAVEALGHSPRLVRGSLENFKVTFPSDFELADRLLRTRT
jgi:2-C-methyl-D-erythritol 4-phosphate cytidylyltransferase